MSETLNPELKKDLDKLEARDYSSLEKQIDAERRLAWLYSQPKLEEAGRRLKLYNNQRRDKDKVGDPLLFTVFQTILAALYDDRLIVTFSGREEGDQEVAENLINLAQYDAEQMGKDQIDHDWIWDSLFFGRAVLYFNEFMRDEERGLTLPLPEVIDPMTFLRDPRATSLNGDLRGRGAARFFGRYIWMTKYEMESHPEFIRSAINGMKAGSSAIEDLVRKARAARSEAQGEQDMTKLDKFDLGENSEYGLLEWCTYWKGNKVLATLGEDGNKVVRYKELGSGPWGAIDRALYPTAHDWDGASIPDFVEDKQRARSVVQNLAIDGVKAELNPMYIYDKNRISNKADLHFEFNKFIPSMGPADGAISPVQKATMNTGVVSFILETLDVASQRATATPEVQQGIVAQEKRTLGEINLVASKADTRYSLSARIFGWSEQRFWQQWYKIYKEHFVDEIDEKVVRISGAYGPTWRPLKRSNIIAKVDPDVQIESRAIGEGRKLRERTAFVEYLKLLATTPDINMRYGLRKAARLYGLPTDEINRLIPKTIDERMADEENDKLAQGETVFVKAGDNHTVHLELHAKAGDTKEAHAHKKAHEEALLLKRENPALFPGDQQAIDVQSQTGQAPTLPTEGLNTPTGVQPPLPQV